MAYTGVPYHPAHHEPVVHGAWRRDFVGWWRSVVSGETTASFLFGAIVTITALVFLVPMFAF